MAGIPVSKTELREAGETITKTSPVTRIRHRAVSGLLSVLLGLGLAVSGVPSPLYSAYQQQWGFSSLTLTVVFAAYAGAALLSVLFVGKLSDSIGRKPVLLAAQAALLVGLTLLVLAQSVWWVLAARAVHGLAIGAVVVTAGAALLDLRPGEGTATGRRIAMSCGAGMTAGIGMTSVLAHTGPAPMITPYVVAGTLTVITLVYTARTRETNLLRVPLDLRVQPPKVPPAVREAFRFAALGVCAAWAVLGVYLSLVPKLVEHLVGGGGPLIGGGAVTVMVGSATLAQAWAGAADALRTAIAGDLVLGFGLVLSVVLPGTPAVFTAALVIGTGYGLGFSGSLRHLTEVIPAAHRGEVMSAYYLVAYGSLAVPAVLAGFATNHFGITKSYLVFALAVALVCGVAAWLGRRTARLSR